MKWSVCIPALALLILLVHHAVPQPVQAPLSPAVFARIEAGPLNELSGLVKSRRHPDLYWAHNDSGDRARLFALDGQGRSILPTYSKFTYYGDEPEQGKQQWQGFDVLYADNVDWEDIAVDANYLYVADVGNNLNRRDDLAIYALSEIDPTASTRSAVIRMFPVVYPEQQAGQGELHYDSEALFVADGKLYLITKHRRGRLLGGWEPGAHLYRLDTDYTDRANLLLRIDSHPALTAATGADLSPDGNVLAVVSYDGLWLFGRPASGDRWFSEGEVRHWPLDTSVLRQVESVAWMDQDRLLLGNEQRELFQLRVSALPGR